MFHFGSGSLWAIPDIDPSGAPITTPTPIPFGALQEGSIEVATSIKELFGQYQYPIDVAPGSKKITGKAKAAKITAAMFNLVFGVTPITGEIKVGLEESRTIPDTYMEIYCGAPGLYCGASDLYCGAPGFYPCAIIVAFASTFGIDLGVKFTATGLPLIRVASDAPLSAGKYKVNSGEYVFSVEDKSLMVKISYTYTTSAAPGQVLGINNQLIGQSLYWKGVFNGQYKGKQITLTLYRCVSAKLVFAAKTEDYVIPELDFEAMPDDAGQVYQISLSDGGA